MPVSKNVNASRIIKFGKKPAKRDARNLKLSAILKVPAKLPPEYDFDVQHKGVPTPMFGNDVHGDCVIAGRAHQTLRFEDAETSKIINITLNDVLKEWHAENGNTEQGLNVLDSLKLWRTKGWLAAKKRYRIKAFAEINRKVHDEVKGTVYSDIGVGLGLSLPDSAIPEFHAGKPWADTSGPAKQENGHYVYVPGYTTVGPVCVTWGRKQQMTWAFFDKYCDEAYAIIDAIDSTKRKQFFDGMKVRSFLEKLKK